MASLSPAAILPISASSDVVCIAADGRLVRLVAADRDWVQRKVCAGRRLPKRQPEPGARLWRGGKSWPPGPPRAPMVCAPPRRVRSEHGRPGGAACQHPRPAGAPGGGKLVAQQSQQGYRRRTGGPAHARRSGLLRLVRRPARSGGLRRRVSLRQRPALHYGWLAVRTAVFALFRSDISTRRKVLKSFRMRRLVVIWPSNLARL